ncbi:MAG TPA: hypothetical protein VEB68_09120 [Croceibacterium sp.]|nr:hypothetical protein [Croceibacterium sp.]
MSEALAAPAPARFPFARVALVWAGLCAIILLVNLGGILQRKFPDPDDMLRLVQVRDLLAGQGWFDLHQYRIDPPEGVLMHWSRLVDIPLAATIGMLTPLIGQAGAEMTAMIAVPLLTLGAIMFVAARIAARFFDTEAVTFVCLSLGLSPLLVAQIQPLRIDHHGWQIFSVVVALLGLLPGRGAKGAALSGAALAFGLSISLEVLPIMAAFGGAFGLRWLLERDSRSLPAFLAALTGSLVVLFLATRGVADLAAHCDAVSPPYLGLLALVTALVAGIAWLRPRSPAVLVGLLGAAGAAGLALFLASAPQCSSGPFAGLDPLVREFWYEKVLEGLPFWRINLLLSIPVVIGGAIALGVLAHFARHRAPAERRWWLEYLLVATIAYLTALLVWRSQGFVGALSAIPLGWLALQLLARLRTASGNWRKLAAGLTVILVLLPAFPAAVARTLVNEETVGTGKLKKVSESECEMMDHTAKLDRFAPATIFAPLDIGPAIVEMSHHRVVATGHHRGEAAMRDVIAAFTGTPEQAHAQIRRHGARYVVICTDLYEVELFVYKSPGSFAEALSEERAPAWLERIDIGAPEKLQVWRVKS